MAGRVLAQSERGVFPAVIESDRFCDFSTPSIRQHLPSQSETEMSTTAKAIGLGCVRGTTLALFFEAATAVGIYGIWRLIHLLY